MLLTSERSRVLVGSRWFFRWVAMGLLAALPAGAAPNRPIDGLFAPFRVDQVALAPDGVHLAYTVHDGTTLNLVVTDLDHPEAKSLIPIGSDQTTGVFTRRVLFSAQVPFLRWSDAGALVYVRRVREDVRKWQQELRTVEADGKGDRLLLDGVDIEYLNENDNFVPRRLRAIGFPLGAPGVLILEAVGDDQKIANALFSVDLQTGKLSFIEEKDEEGRMLYDQQIRPRLVENAREHIYLEGLPMSSGGGTGTPIRIQPPPPEIVTQHFRLREPGLLSRWQDIDSLLGPEAGLAFKHGDPDYFGPRAIPLGFGADPEILFYASNAGRNTFGVYSLDLRTKQRTDFALEDPRVDLIDFSAAEPESALVFDRQHRLAGVRVGGVPSRTRWIDPNLARLQQRLDGKFPARDVEIVDWDAAVRRVIALVAGPGDPGRYFVFDDGAPGRLSEIIRRAPRLTADLLNRAVPIEFTTRAGITLTGTVTLPRQPRLNPAPLVMLIPDLTDWRDRGEFARDAQALAAAGFMVATVDYRGRSGLGAAHRDAAKAGFDRVPIEDLRATIDWLAVHQPFDRRRVALVGEGFGGYLALRALELHPTEFRSAVTFNAPTDLASWALEERGKASGAVDGSFDSSRLITRETAARQLFFGGDKAALEAISVLKDAALITKPVLIIQENRSSLWPAHGTDLRNRLKKQPDAEVEFVALDAASDRSTPEGTVKTYRRVTDFLTETLYDFGVKIGEAKEKKD